MRMILLNPGPVTLTDRVRRTLGSVDWCHREPEFAELTHDIAARLVSIYPDMANRYVALMLSGSGTCAVESMLASLAPNEQTTLVVANGVYGERMIDMLQAHRKPVASVRSEWHAPMDLARVRHTLEADPGISHVAAVHHETTTGRLNDISALAELCRQYGCHLLLDAVSSFGAEQILFEDWAIQGLAATANKCLHGVPGVSFVIVDRGRLASRPSHAGSVYLDLFRYARTQLSDGYSPFTQAIQCSIALREALRELEESGGWRARRQRYRELSHLVRECLEQCGVQTLLSRDEQSCVLCSYRLPEDVRYDDLHDVLKDSGFVIYAGQGAYAAKMFRISTMGAIEDADLQRFESALRAFFR